MWTLPPCPKLYEVAVLFRHGHGDRFNSAAEALEYAETEMHKLLGQWEELEQEDFEGIYCTRTDTNEVWRFDYEEGAAVWVAETAGCFEGKRRTALILPFRSRV
jgi:hypothetical protein